MRWRSSPFMSTTSGAPGPGSPTFRLSLAALPFTLLMRALNGGTYAFGGDMMGRVIAAGAVRLGARIPHGSDRGDDPPLSRAIGAEDPPLTAPVREHLRERRALPTRRPPRARQVLRLDAGDEASLECVGRMGSGGAGWGTVSQPGPLTLVPAALLANGGHAIFDFDCRLPGPSGLYRPSVWRAGEGRQTAGRQLFVALSRGGESGRFAVGHRQRD